MVLDVGSQSIERIKGAIDDAATLVWNGPLGAFEMPPFDAGTVDVARYAAARTKAGKLISVAGGGDTVAERGVKGIKCGAVLVCDGAAVCASRGFCGARGQGWRSSEECLEIDFSQ
jgi:3-phosphoglycerate kinase